MRKLIAWGIFCAVVGGIVGLYVDLPPPPKVFTTPEVEICPPGSPMFPERLETNVFTAAVLCRSEDFKTLRVERIEIGGRVDVEEYSSGNTQHVWTMTRWLRLLDQAEAAGEVKPKPVGNPN